jgi:hypothetical protein
MVIDLKVRSSPKACNKNKIPRVWPYTILDLMRLSLNLNKSLIKSQKARLLKIFLVLKFH